MTRNHARTLVAGIALLVCGVAGAGINAWTVNGPQGGNFGDLERSPTAPNTVYAGVGHSFFRSTNGGRTWNSGYHFEEQVNEIAIDPTDATRVYVATVSIRGAYGGIYRTEDGGNTFSKVADPWGGAWGVGVGGPDGRTVYYSASNAFARSTDRGVTWSVRDTSPNNVRPIIVDPVDPDRLVGMKGYSLARSSDGGATWIQTTPNGSWPITGLVRVSSSVLVMSTNLGLFRSTDAGDTWAQVSGYYPAWSVASDPANPQTLLAAAIDGFPPLRSTDGGLTWTSVAQAPRLRIVRGLAINGPNLLAVDEDGAQLSSDGGNTWSAAPRGPVGGGVASLFAADHHGSPVFASTTGFSLFTSQSGAAWQLIPGMKLGQSSFVAKPDDARILYASAFNNGVLKSVDGGNSWTNIGGFWLADFILGIGRSDTNRLYAAIQWPFNALPNTTGRLFTTTDGGNNWSEIATNLPVTLKVSKIAVDPLNTSRLFLAANNTQYGMPESGGLWLSVDGGQTFSERGFAGRDVDDVAIDLDDPRYVYVASAAGFFSSSDGGLTFARNPGFTAISPLAAGSVALDPEIPSTVYASSGNANAFSDGLRTSWLLRSVDRGANWEVLRQDTASPNYYVNRMVVDPSLTSQLFVNTGVHGVASFEVRTDLTVAIAGHTGAKRLRVPTSYQATVTNKGPFHATRVQIAARVPAQATGVSWTAPVGGFCARHGARIDCEVPVLRSAEAAVVTVRYTPTQVGAIVVRADASGHERDLNGADNSAVATASATP